MKRFVEGLEVAEPTYSDIGATLAGKCPRGVSSRPIRDRARPWCWCRFSEQSWVSSGGRRICLPGMKLFPHNQEIRTGATVVVMLGTPDSGFGGALSDYRALLMVDLVGSSRTGRSRGHPEQGEESFVVSMSADQTVRFEIKVFSRPGDPSSGCRVP